MSYIIKKTSRIDAALIESVYNSYRKCKHITSDFTLDYVQKSIDDIIKYGVGFELIDDNKPVAFISAYQVDPLFYGQKGYYTPEVGLFYNGHLKQLNILLKALYEEMKKEGYTHHVVSRLIPINEDQWFAMGYGSRVIDVARIVEAGKTGLTLKRIKPEDIDSFYPLYKEHNHYMTGAPIFLDGDESLEGCMEAIKEDDEELYFLKKGTLVVGFTTLSKTSPAGSKLFKDNQTLALKGAHILSNYQHQGYGRQAIQAVMNYAKDLGYKKLSTDFESFNVMALNFWPKSLDMVAKSFVRYIG